MKRWTLNYWRKPTNLHVRQRALIEADTAEDAIAVLKHQLQDVQENDLLYWYQTPEEVKDAPPPQGKVINLDH